MIVYIITKLELGGAQKVCLELVKGMEHNNVPVSLISGPEGLLIEEIQKNPWFITIKSLKRELSFRGLVQEIKSFFELIQTLKALKQKNSLLVVHTHSTKAGILGRWAAFFARVSLRIHTVHGFGFNDQQPWLKWIIIYMCELLTSVITTHFVCVSDKDRQRGIQLFPGFLKKSSLIRASINWDAFAIKPAILASEKRSFIIGTVSCFKPQKNLFDLLNAFKHVYKTLSLQKASVLQLHIIGDGIQRKEIEDWIKKENLGHVIKLLGWQLDVASWMDTWSIFAMSSLWEGLPCAIVEARLRKLPIVAYDIDGIPEIVKHNVNGLLAPVGDWKILAKHITLLIQDPACHSRLSTYLDDLQDFDNKTMVKEHLKLYSHLKSSP